MFELFKGEFLRCRNKAIGLFFLQLIGWQIVAQFKPLLEAAPLQTAGYHLPIIFASLAFGILQMRVYANGGYWTFLLQRPLSRPKIFSALALAALFNLLIAVPSAWLIMVASLDLFTNSVVDSRHYYHAFFVLLVALSSYLVGTFVRLNASRGAILVGLGLIFTNEIANEIFWLVASRTLLIIAVLFYLNIQSFKPDLSQKISSPLATVIMAIPMQVMIVFALFLLTGPLYHLPTFMFGAHPNQNPVEGSYEQWRSQPKETRLTTLFKNQDDENLVWLARQSELAEQGQIRLDIQQFSNRGMLYIYDKQYGLVQDEGEHLWVFSHDKMLVKGINTRTDDITGWLGQRGFIDDLEQVKQQDRFESVPLLVGSKFILTKTSLLQVNFIDRRLALKFKLENNEYFISQPQSNKHYVALVSNHKTYLFEPNNFYQDHVVSAPDYSVEHPTAIENISFIDSYRMVDGYLLNYIGTGFERFDRAGFKLIYARRDNNNRIIHEAEFTKSKYPDLIQHFKYTISPVIYVLNESIFHAFVDPSNYKSLQQIWQWEFSPMIKISIAFLQFFSAVTVFIYSRRLRMKPQKMLLWVSMTILIGVPSLVCFFFLNHTKEILKNNQLNAKKA